MAGGLAGRAHRGLLFGWRYLPFWARRVAVHLLFGRFPLGAVAIIHDGHGRLLMLRQTYHRGEIWGVPGGWLRPGEEPRDAVARETLEETGLRVSVGRVVAVATGPFGEVSFAFECRLAPGQTVRLSDESDRAAYFPVTSLPPVPLGLRRLLDEAFGPGGIVVDAEPGPTESLDPTPVPTGEA